MSKPNPFKGFHSTSEIIRPPVMKCIWFLLSLCNVEDFLHERGVDICRETVRRWWQRFGPMFASESRKWRVAGMRSSRWQ